jgi:hypothetical protein
MLQYKSPGSDRSELIDTGGEKLVFEIHKLIYSIINKEELLQQWYEFIIEPIT